MSLRNTSNSTNANHGDRNGVATVADVGRTARDISDLLFEMRCRGIRVSAENDRLRYQVERGSLTQEDRMKLSLYKSDILFFLKVSRADEETVMPLLPRPPSCDVVPLTPSQHLVWRTYFGVGSKRYVIAMRITGPVNIEWLQETFQELTARHEPLRTSIVFVDDMPCQRIGTTPSPALRCVELAGASLADREEEARDLAEKIANDRIDFSRDLLFDARLAKLGEQDFVLMLRVHALASDATSTGILLRDMWSIYIAHVRGVPASLPRILQLADLSVWHMKGEMAWRSKCGEYWRKRLCGAERISIFRPDEMADEVGPRVQYFSYPFEDEVFTKLHMLAGRHRVSMGMIMLTAWIASILRWCGESEVVVSFLTDGRVHAEIESAVGTFMCSLYLRIKVQRSDTFDDLVGHVIEEYGNAYRNHDFCRLIALASEACVRNPNLNWAPNGFYQNASDTLDAVTQESGVSSPFSVRPFEFKQMPPKVSADSDLEPRFGIVEVNNRLRGGIVCFSEVPLRLVEKCAENIRFVAGTMAENPSMRVLDMPSIARSKGLQVQN